jgi:two-component system, OmpR family, response regulator MprA
MYAMLSDPRHCTSTAAESPLAMVVESDARMSSFLDRVLSNAGYRVESVTGGPGVVQTLFTLRPDVVLLDTNLRGIDGLDITRGVRQRSGVPILMLGHDTNVQARIAGLDAGADDFLGKPFVVDELLARIRAVLRGRALSAAASFAEARQGALAYADIRLDQDTREAYRGMRKLELRNRAFELLVCFLRHPERVLSRKELLEKAWGYEFLGDSNVVDVTIGHLRQALEADGEGRVIHTIRPVGYILRAR